MVRFEIPFQLGFRARVLLVAAGVLLLIGANGCESDPGRKRIIVQFQQGLDVSQGVGGVSIRERESGASKLSADELEREAERLTSLLSSAEFSNIVQEHKGADDPELRSIYFIIPKSTVRDAEVEKLLEGLRSSPAVKEAYEEQPPELAQ